MNRIGGQFARFALVGVAATATHYAILIVLKEMLGVDPVIGTVIGYLFGTLVSYSLNRRFTFSERPAFARGLAKFAAVYGIGAGLNALIMALLTNQGAHYLLAQVTATGVTLVWNFAAARLFVFREPPVG